MKIHVLQARRRPRPVAFIKIIILLHYCLFSLFTSSYSMRVTPTATMSNYFDYSSLSRKDLPSKMPKMVSRGGGVFRNDTYFN